MAILRFALDTGDYAVVSYAPLVLGPAEPACLAAPREAFVETGDASRLGRFLTEKHQKIRRNPPEAVASRELPTRLHNLGNGIVKLSLALQMGRPLESAKAARLLDDLLQSAHDEIERWAPPFGILLDEIQKTYCPLSCVDDDIEAQLKSQWRMIQWYLDRGQSFVASPVAREWLVSIVCWKKGLQWLERADRLLAEGTLNRIANGENSDSDLSAEARLGEIWRNLGQFRNDAMHCGFTLSEGADRNALMQADSLQKNILNLRQPLTQIAITYGWAEG